MPGLGQAPGPLAPGPYRQVGSDGRLYFKVLPGIRGLAVVYVEALKLFRDLGALNHPAAPAKRQLLAKVIADLETEIRAAELLVAQATDDAIKRNIAATQKRPNRTGNMAAGVESRPLPYPDFPFFAVGQADLQRLDNSATGVSGKPYWPSQEFGYKGNVGRTVTGGFMPGNVRPDPSQSRVHPVFQAGASPNTRMRIQNPIEERAFLRAGAMEGALLRARLWKQIEKKAVADIRRVVTLGAPVRRAVRKP